MRTYTLLFYALVLLTPFLAQAQSNQRETVIIRRPSSGSTTVEISPGGVYVNGEQVATRNELNNRNLNKRIVIEDNTSGATRSYDDYWNSSGGNASESRRAVLGVYTGPSSQEGAFIQSITPNSAAEMAGLRNGDVITRIDTSYVDDAAALTRVVRTYSPGDRVIIHYRRNGKDRQTTATLKESTERTSSRVYEYSDPRWNTDPSEPLSPFSQELEQAFGTRPQLGVTVEDLANDRGVRIISVRSGSPAETSGIRADDIITAIDGYGINNVDDLQRRVANLKPGATLKVEMIRGNDKVTKRVYIPKPRNSKDL
jgi:serine protease Do